MPSAVRSPAPARFADHTLASYTPRTEGQRKALFEATRMEAGDIRNLVLVGPPGVGKTHLAAGIVNARQTVLLATYDREVEAATDRMPTYPKLARWLNVSQHIVWAKMEFSQPSDDRRATEELIQAGRYSGLVVLDDLGREKVSDWTGELIYTLVNARYEAMLSTVVTSNLSAAELAASPYWPAISRLAEDGALVTVSGPDHRLRSA